MKKYTILTLTLVLTAALLVGCGCTKQDTGNTSAPTVLPTNEEIWNTSEATTQPTTMATTAPTETRETIDHGNGPLEDTISAPTDESGSNGNSRSGGNGGTVGSNGSGRAGGSTGSGITGGGTGSTGGIGIMPQG